MVPCHILLHQLTSLGLNITGLSWFSSYIIRQLQMVQLRNHQPEPSPVNTGVPQGSVPGPFLFILNVLQLGSIFMKPWTPMLPSPKYIYHLCPSLALNSTTYQLTQSPLLHLITVMLFYMFSPKIPLQSVAFRERSFLRPAFLSLLLSSVFCCYYLCRYMCVCSSDAQGNQAGLGIKDWATDGRDH